MDLREACQCTLRCVERFQSRRLEQSGGADKHCRSNDSVESKTTLTRACSQDLQQKQV